MANERFDPDILLEHGGFVRALVRSLLADQHVANDVEQQTWLTAMRHPPRTGSSVRAYLAVIAKNFVRRAYREDSRRHRALETLAARSSSVPSREEILAVEEQRRRVIDAVLELEEIYRTVIVLRYLEELSPGDIGKRIGIPVDSVKTRLKRGLAQLRTRFESENVPEETPWHIALLPLARLSANHGIHVPVCGLGTLAGVLLMKPITVLGLVITVAVGSLWWWSNDSREETPSAVPHTDSEERSTEVVAANSADSIERLASATIDADKQASPEVVTTEARLIHGRVTFEDGSPAAGATVEARRCAGEQNASLPEFSGVGELLDSSETNSQGEFTIDAKRAFRVDLLATHPTRSFAAESGVALEDEPELILERYAEVRGHVRRKADGAPVADAVIRTFRSNEPWRQRVFRTGGDGTYAISDLAPGAFSVALESVDYADPNWQHVEVAPGAVLQLDFDLLDGVAVRGRVTDAITHQPIADAEISAGWTFRSTVRTDAEGRYEFRGFGDAGVHDLHCRAHRYGRTETAPLELGDSVTEREVNFQLMPAKRARGVLVDRLKKPIEGARVVAIASDFVQVAMPESNVGTMKQVFDLQSTTSAADGSFVIENLRPDARHALYIEPRSESICAYEFPSNELESPEIEFGYITIASSQRIQGLLLDANSTPLGRARVILRGNNEDRLRWTSGDAVVVHGLIDERSAITSAAGEFLFDRVASGTYQLAYARDEGSPEVNSTVAVVEGEDVLGARLILPAPHFIRGRIESESGVLPRLVNIGAISGDDPVAMPTTTVMHPDGTFEIELTAAGSYSIHVTSVRSSESDPRFQPAWIEKVETGRDDVVIRLAIAAVITGTVLDSDGKPMTAGHIVLRDAFGSIASWTTPDANGHFTLVVTPGAQGNVEARSLAKQNELLGDADPSNDDSGWSQPVHATANQENVTITLSQAG